MSENRSNGRNADCLALREECRLLGSTRGMQIVWLYERSREEGMITSREIDAIVTTVGMLIIGCIAWEIDANNNKR